MTRLVLAVAAVLVFAAGAATPASAQEICQGVVDTVCEEIENLPCTSPCRVEPCHIVDCTPPYVGCIQGYFCV